MQLFSAVFYVVRAVREFDFRLVMKETTNTRKKIIAVRGT